MNIFTGKSGGIFCQISFFLVSICLMLHTHEIPLSDFYFGDRFDSLAFESKACRREKATAGVSQ